MTYFVIHGGKSLNGDISVCGAKNAALKLIAAALLSSETCVIKNVPDIADVHSFLDILRKLGVEAEYHDHTLTLLARDLADTDPDYQQVKHFRASVMVIGPLLARKGNVRIPLPGGCLIGARPITTHINAFRQMGAQVERDGDLYTFTAPKLRGTRIVLDEMSVTATENAMIAACLADGDTQIHLAASEPEVADLAQFLNTMGARIDGAGTAIIKIQGVAKLHGAEHTIIPDRIEAGTLAVAAAVSRGTVYIRHIIPDHIDAVLNALKRANVRYVLKPEDGSFATLQVLPTTVFEPLHIATQPYPGFPTDLQAPLGVLMTQANGTSRIFETLYDGRLGYIRELQRMGAQAEIVDTHTAVITGPTVLHGKHITSPDIRAGATLLIAALIAEGESRLDGIERIDRGYEHIDERLRALGASITRHTEAEV